MQKLICIILIIGFACLGEAAFENVNIGARPMGMGGAYSAIADDTTAIFWNPAGLAKASNRQVGLSYLELYGMVNYNFVSLVNPVNKTDALAGYLMSSNDSDHLYRETTLGFSYAREVWHGLKFGGNLKFLSSDANIGDIKVGSAKGIAMDIGVCFDLNDKILLGASLPNLLSYVAYKRNKLKRASAKSYTEGLTREYRLSVAYRSNWLNRKLSSRKYALDTQFAAELANNNLAFGLETNFGEKTNKCFAVRIGYRLSQGVSNGICLGLGYHRDRLEIDYAFAAGRYHAQTHQFSIILH